MVTIAKERRPLFVPNESSKAVISSSVDISGSVVVTGGITGSIKNTVAGNPFIAAGANITTTYNSSGQWVITGTGEGGGGGFVGADLVSLTQATNAETTDSIAYIVTDPNGTPRSRKSTLVRLGTRNVSWIEKVFEVCGVTETVTAANNTTGVMFVAARAGQSCTGVRFYWPEAAVRSIKCSLWARGNSTALKSVTVSTNGTAGYFTGIFENAESLVTTDSYIVSVYETSGNVVYVGMLPPDYGIGNMLLYPYTRPYEMRDYTLVTGAWYGSGGDSLPVTNYTIATRIYAVEPLISG